MWFCVSFFFSLFFPLLLREKKERKKKPIRVLVRRRARRCDRLQHASTRSIERQPHAGLVVPSGGENGGKEKKKKKEERRRSRSKKIHELIDSKDSNRDLIKRRVATSREVDRHEYDATNLHSEPPPFIFLPCDAFYFGLRDVFRACFFMTF